MLPPVEMLTNKKRCCKWLSLLLLTAAVAWIAGCTPAGPRALLRGKRLIEQGRYTEAVDSLKTATSILTTNAQAWNYLGLAYHHAGQPANAAEAYQRALRLNHDLLAAHYNLGCLLLEQNRPDTLEGARNELTAYVMRQGNSTDGWLKLGTAQLRLTELNQAESSFKEVLRLNPQNAEALNDLGILQMQRKRNRDAVNYFNAALKQQPNYGPALLNLAVCEGYLNNQALALQTYQQYLELKPRQDKWDAVKAIADQLDAQLNPPPVRPPTNIVVAATNPPTNTPIRTASPPTNPVIVASIPQRSSNTSTTQPPVIDNSVPPEVVKVPDAPPIKIAGTGTSTAPNTAPISPTTQPDAEMPIDPRDVPANSKTNKRGFFSKLNPVNLFRNSSGKTKTPSTTTSPLGPPGDATPSPADTGAVSEPAPAPIRPLVIPVYTYISPARPAPGNRTQADKFVAQASEARSDHRLQDAVSLYQSAVQADPSDFDAQSGLGVSAFESGDLPQSFRAYETALTINPQSFIARFNFGLALKKAGYIRDAAQELERLLVTNANESPAHLAAVHLTLANLYAEQFHQNAPARAHYLKVLELDPHNSQATSIRYWLQDNG